MHKLYTNKKIDEDNFIFCSEYNDGQWFAIGDDDDIVEYLNSDRKNRKSLSLKNTEPSTSAPQLTMSTVPNIPEDGEEEEDELPPSLPTPPPAIDDDDDDDEFVPPPISDDDDNYSDMDKPPAPPADISDDDMIDDLSDEGIVRPPSPDDDVNMLRPPSPDSSDDDNNTNNKKPNFSRKRSQPLPPKVPTPDENKQSLLEDTDKITPLKNTERIDFSTEDDPSKLVKRVTTSTLLEAKDIILEGYMDHLYGKVLSMWRSFYFVLTKSKLKFYDTKNDFQTRIASRGVVDLADCIITKDIPSKIKRKHVLAILHKDNDQPFFVGTRQDNYQVWYNLLNDTLETLNKDDMLAEKKVAIVTHKSVKISSQFDKTSNKAKQMGKNIIDAHVDLKNYI